MRPDRIKMFRALEDANPDVGAMVDEIPAPDGDAMVFEEGIDLTDVPAPAAAPPVVAQAPTLPEYDATADKAALARAQAADSERNAARALIQGVHQMGASLAGGPVTQTTLAPGTAEAKAMAAADKNKADAKARRVEALRLLEMGEATKRSTAALTAAEARAKAAQAEADRRAKEQREYQIGENEKMRTAAMERAQVMAGVAGAKEKREQGKEEEATAPVGVGDDREIVPAEGYPPLRDGPRKTSLALIASAVPAIHRATSKIKALTSHMLKNPIAARTDGAIGALETEVNSAIAAMTVAQKQGAVQGSDAERAKAQLGQMRGLSSWVDRASELLGNSDARKDLANYAAALNATDDIFEGYLAAEAASSNQVIRPRKRKLSESGKPAAREIATNPKTGERRYILPDGSLGEVVK